MGEQRAGRGGRFLWEPQKKKKKNRELPVDVGWPQTFQKMELHVQTSRPIKEQGTGSGGEDSYL
jgi:hypothetical protein